MRVTDRCRERGPVRREEIMLVTIREQRHVSEPIEKIIYNFDC